MDRGLIDSFEINFKSVFRNLKFAILLGALLFALCVSAEAQQPEKLRKIGFLEQVGGPAANIAAFRQGLRGLGYIEGQNIVLNPDPERAESS